MSPRPFFLTKSRESVDIANPAINFADRLMTFACNYINHAIGLANARCRSGAFLFLRMRLYTRVRGYFSMRTFARACRAHAPVRGTRNPNTIGLRRFFAQLDEFPCPWQVFEKEVYITCLALLPARASCV